MFTRLVATLTAVSAANAAPPAFTKIGDHPVSVQTPYPAILSITPFQGRLYFGYGDYNQYPPIVMVSYDPSDRLFRLEHSVASDAVDSVRVLGNDLWLPHVDPIHFEDFQDFSFKRDGVWREMAPMGCFHVFDCLQSPSGAIYIAGSDWMAGGLLARSRDNGRTWQALDRNSSVSRYYWCFELNGRIYTQGGAIDDASDTFQRGGLFSGLTYLGKPTRLVPQNGQPWIMGVLRAPASWSTGTSIVAFDGTTMQTVAQAAMDFAVDGSHVYVLNSAKRLLSADAPDFAPLALTDMQATGLPNDANSIAATEGAFYVGTTGGAVYGSLPTGPAPAALATVNELPAAHGRGLAFHETALAIGSPDATPSPTTPMSGSATVWQEPAVAAATWLADGSITTPNPDLSGWFGKKLAISGDLMAVVESGADNTNADRGSAALVRVFRRNGAAWVAAAAQTVPFAHSVALVPALDAMVVGTGNPSASQTAGTPSLNVYGITRGAGGAIALQVRSNLVPSSAYNNWGYKPVVRVAVVGDWVIGSFAGDPSRNGGQGMAVGWRKTASNPTTFSTTQQWQQFPATAARFGHGLSADGEWIAIGAPRDDTAAANSGAVYLYKLSNGVPENTPWQKVVCPVPEAEAEFGYSVALRGKTLLVGAPGLAEGPDLGRGAAFVFTYAGNTWTPVGTLTRPASSLQRFGIEVAIGDVWMAAASRISIAGTSAIDSLALVRRPDPDTAFDRWLAASAPALGNLDPLADPDRDGLPVLLEYISGLKPAVPDAPDFSEAVLPLPLGMPLRDANGTTVDFAYPSNDPRLSVDVMGSEDLLTWSVPALPAVALGNSGAYSRWRRSFPPAGARYFRLGASYRR